MKQAAESRTSEHSRCGIGAGLCGDKSFAEKSPNLIVFLYFSQITTPKLDQ